jgi:hypothetical protein
LASSEGYIEGDNLWVECGDVTCINLKTNRKLMHLNK